MSEGIQDKRWGYLRNILERPGPFCHPEFQPSPEILDFISNICRILVVGAGGLGCELLKNLALMGFRNIDVIDMDTIDLSNLNRQFLFRQKDIGSSKAEVAANFINRKIPGCNVRAHFCKIQDYDEDFYSQFHIIVCGLDSVAARRWINGMLISMLRYDEDSLLDNSSVIPLVDGGTEGFKGNARVIVPGSTACVECTLDLYPPQVSYPLCTIAHTPRLPEHCVEYVKVVQWAKENPFNAELDGDDPQHVAWVCEKATERANQFNITGMSHRLAQGVLKNIIPAVASTNAVIAGVCATEVFKIATSCCLPLRNYMIFNAADGIYTYTYEAERKDDCLVCSQVPQVLHVDDKMKLRELLEMLSEDERFQFKSPGITTSINGKNKTLYMSSVKSIEERTRSNLSKLLSELGLLDGSEIMVTDVTSPTTLTFKLKYNFHDVDMK